MKSEGPPEGSWNSLLEEEDWPPDDVVRRKSTLVGPSLLKVRSMDSFGSSNTDLLFSKYGDSNTNSVC